MTARRYELARPSRGVWGVVVIAVMIVVGIFGATLNAKQDVPTWYRVLFLSGWYLILAFMGYRASVDARRIVVGVHDKIEFIGWLSTTTLTPQDIHSVEVLEGRDSKTVVNHSGGRLYLAGPMNDFHLFLKDLREHNPGVNFIGC